jgi:glycosyltransferase involved in cell wall biosynthesis
MSWEILLLLQKYNTCMAEEKEIVFINQNAGYLMIDIIHAHEQYTRRSFITGSLTERDIKLDASVKIEKIIKYNRSSGIKRLFTWGWAFIQICWLVKTRHRKADLFIVSNPPFAVFIPLICKNPFSLLVYDVYPDALVAFHFFGDQAYVTRLWRKANRRIFAKAKKIFTISNGMKKVLAQYVPADSIQVVPVWSHNDFLKPVPKADNLFIRQQGWQDKFLVIYSGNLGHTHDIEMLVEMAAKITDDTIHFVIIGDGDKKQLLKEQIAAFQLTNCSLMPWQEVAMLPYSLSAADLAVVSLGKEASALSVPSKTFNLLSVGAPLICITAAASELSALVHQYQLGECFEATEIDRMIEFIYKVKSNSGYQLELRQHALKASKDFGPENALRFVQT